MRLLLAQDSCERTLRPFLLFPQSSIIASIITHAYGEHSHRAKILLLDLLLLAIIRLKLGVLLLRVQDRLSRLPQLFDHLACWSRYSVSSILRERVPCILLIAMNDPISTPLSILSRALCLLDAFCPLFSPVISQFPNYPVIV